MDETMTDEERANSDKLDSYFKDNLEVHFTLKRKLLDGKNIFLNGFITGRASDRVWIVKDRKMGEIRVSISEIVPNGVVEAKGEEEK